MDKSRWPNPRRKVIKQPMYVAPKSLSKPVVQPEGAYPRYFYWFVLRKPNGKKEKFAAAAYSDEMAEKQARSLAEIFIYEFVKVIKGKRIWWGDRKNIAHEPWVKRAITTYNKERLTK